MKGVFPLEKKPTNTQYYPGFFQLMGMSLIGIKSQENDRLIHPLPFTMLSNAWSWWDAPEGLNRPLLPGYSSGCFIQHRPLHESLRRLWISTTKYCKDVTCFGARWLTTTLLLLQGRLVGWRTLHFGGPSDLGRRCRDNDRRAVLYHSQSGFFHNFLWPFQGSRKGPVFIQLPLGRTFGLITRRMETKLASIFQSGQGQNPDEDKQIRNISQKKWCYMCVYRRSLTTNLCQSCSISAICKAWSTN